MKKDKVTLWDVLKILILIAPIITAIIYSIYTSIVAPRDIYEYMILLLLFLISTSLLVSVYESNVKISNFIEKYDDNMSHGKHKVYSFASSDECGEMIEVKLKKGVQNIDVVSLDQKTRSKKNRQSKHYTINMLNEVAKDNRIKLRYIFVPRKKNSFRIIERINLGYDRNSFFSYIESDTFPFASFIIFDDDFMMMRSPYDPSNASKYLIIQSKEIIRLYKDWFISLWEFSTKVNTKISLEELFSKTKQFMSEEELKKTEDMINSIDFGE